MINGGRFKKGNKGKPKGAKSSKTLEWEAFGKELLEHGMPRALEVLQTCEDEKFLNHFTNLLEYFKPKLARVDSLGLDKDTPPLVSIKIVD